MLDRIILMDVRPQVVSVPGQELLTADGVAVKISLLANYEVVDPQAAILHVQDWERALYAELQLALRQTVSAMDSEALFADRNGLAARTQELATPTSARIGVRLNAVGIKDLMVPGKLKEIFAQVVAARKAGLAALEKARGETAALRHLANAARMMDSNPNLLQLRTLHAISESKGSTVVMGIPGQAMVVPLSRSPAAELPEAPDRKEHDPPERKLNPTDG